MDARPTTSRGLAADRLPVSLFALLGLLLLFVLSPGLSAHALDECVACHPAEARAEEEGVHGPNGMGCVKCHGGDPDATTIDEAHSDSSGYRGIIPRGKVPDLCGECHSRTAEMWEAGLRSDAFSLYRESAHGRAVLGVGKTDAATCVDCHDPVHGTPRSLSVGSPLRPEVVHDLCGRCHGKDDLMGSFDRELQIPKKYVRSAHGRAFLEEDNDRSPACTTCHPAHALTPKGVPHHQEFCATCHLQEAEHLGSGPHGFALTDEGDVVSCVHCHTSHEIEEAGPALFGKFCGKCHKEGSRGMEVAGRLRAAIGEAQGNLRSLEDLARDGGADLQAALDEARTLALSLGPLQHSQDDKAVVEAAGKVAAILEAAEEASRAADDERLGQVRGRWKWIPLIWAVVGVNVLLFWLLRRSRSRGDQRPPSAASDAE